MLDLHDVSPSPGGLPVPHSHPPGAEGMTASSEAPKHLLVWNSHNALHTVYIFLHQFLKGWKAGFNSKSFVQGSITYWAVGNEDEEEAPSSRDHTFEQADVQ